MTLTELAEAYVGLRLTVIHEYSGDFDSDYRRLRTHIIDEVNPTLVQHGAKPINVNLVPYPDDN